jgi:hypothetical protein
MASKKLEFNGVEYEMKTATSGCDGCVFADGVACVAECTTGSCELENTCLEEGIIWIKKESKEQQKDSSQEDKKSNPSEGRKYDSGKRQWWYMWQFLPELEQVTDILTFGDKKYPAEDGSNWRLVDNAERRYTSALMRHLSAYLQGEKVDAESGKSHLAHMITNALFLMWFDRK